MNAIKKGTIVHIKTPEERTALVLDVSENFNAWDDIKTNKVLLTDAKEVFYLVQEINTFTGEQNVKIEHLLWLDKKTLDKVNNIITKASSCQ